MMERARGTWTDERLDDLSTSVGRVDEDLRHVRSEMHTRFDALEGRLVNRIDSLDTRLGNRIDAVNSDLGNRIETVNSDLGGRVDALGGRLSDETRALGSNLGRRIDALDARFDALNRTLIQVGGGTIVTVLATLVAVLATRG